MERYGWNALTSAFMRLAPWLRGLPDRRRIVFGTFPSLRAAFSPDDLPLAFILRRDAHRPRAGNGKRHKRRPVALLKGISREPRVYLPPQRAYVRGTLRANVDAREGTAPREVA